MKVHYGLLFLLIVSAFSCDSTVVEIDGKYGIDFNPSRQEHGIPYVTKNMVLREDIAGRRYLYSNPDRDRSIPGHWWKELLTDSLLNLQTERDFFYNPKTEAWLACEYNYLKGSIKFEYQDDSRDGAPILKLKDRLSFDSSLRIWGVVVD